jgi:hypothetical protein
VKDQGIEVEKPLSGASKMIKLERASISKSGGTLMLKNA